MLTARGRGHLRLPGQPSALAQRLLSEASEVDPFEFIGSFASDAVCGRDADEFLDREGFGAP